MNSLPGIDTRVGRASTNGSDALYWRLLNMFRTGQCDVVAQFRAAHSAGDEARATRLVHNVRSAAAILGMQAVCTIGSRLEAACHARASHAELNALLDELDAAMAVVLDGLQVLGTVDDAEAPHP